jgi:transposase
VDTNLIKQAGKRPARRRFSGQFKHQIVMQSTEPGASVSAVAFANELNTNQVFKWRRDYFQQQGNRPAAKADTLLPVVVMANKAARLPAPASQPSPNTLAGHIEVTLRHGRIRVEGAVDSDALRMLVQCLRA